MQAKNVLVFPCGSEIGLELNRALRHSPHFSLFGASSVPDHGEFVYRRYIGGLPMVNEPEFLSDFNRVLSTYAIDYVFPAHDDVLVLFSAWEAEGLLAASVIAPEAAVCRLCRSKGATYSHFAEVLPVPRTWHMSELVADDFPVFIKPDSGQGSKGTLRADDFEAATEKLRRSPLDLISEYLPGPEYTVDCFTDRHRELLYVGGRVRNRMTNGIAVNSVEVKDDRFRRFAEIINHELAMRGAWFFQLKEDADGVLKLLEIAPRIAGTSGLQRAKGVNLPLLSLYDRLGLDLSIIDNGLTHVEIDRALGNSYRLSVEYDAVYIDLDDTLLMDGGVNPEAARFIFQCHNKRKRLVLVTRHFQPPDETLKEYRLDCLFDEVLWLRNGEGKSSVVKPGERAIFIDDSFVEREEVSSQLGIPVFDPSAFEALLEP